MTKQFHSLSIFILILWAFSLGLSVSHADNTPANIEKQSIEEIHSLVYEHLKQKTDQQIYEPEINIRKLNPDLQLPRCEMPLEIHDRSPDEYVGRVILTVICNQPSWKVFMPAEIDGKLPVIMSTQGISKEALIKEADIEQVLVQYRSIPKGSMVNLTKTLGMRAKRPIGAGSIIKITDLQPPYWVYKNQQINLITRIGNIEVATTGIALQNAVEQEQVSVKNTSSNAVVKGIVIAPNTVLVP